MARLFRLMSSPVSSSSRLLHVDALKALAAQAIVLHHLSAYGPIADAVQTMVPALIEFLFRHGRLAVQVFLVVGGFLSARGLSRRGQALEGAVPELLWRRYLRLVLPFMAAVSLTVVCGLLVKPWLPDLVPEEITLVQIVSHALLLQGVLGHEALTAGAWYVAVDFQLFALLLLLLWLARSIRVPRAWRVYAGPLLVLLGVAASLWFFNRIAALDDWALYFFGAYGLGALVHWIGLSRRPRVYLALLVAVGLMALALEWRERVAVALVTALVLALLHARHHAHRHAHHHVRAPSFMPRAGGIASEFSTHSYSLFLVHYPVCLLVNALFEQQGASGGVAGLSMMVMAWGLANLASIPFHRWIEAPAGRLRWGRFADRALQA